MKNHKSLFFSLFLLSFFFFNNLYSQTNPGDVVRYKKISNNIGGLGNSLSSGDYFGSDITNIGDINNDGVDDLAVGVNHYGGYGGVFILFMDTNGTIASKSILAQNTNGISGLTYNGIFGEAVCSMGDINGDGIPDIGVAEMNCSDGGSGTGAIYIITLDTNGHAISQTKISKTTGYGSGGLPISAGTAFGTSLDSIGDINNDGINDVVVGNYSDSQAGINKGAAWVLLLDSNSHVSSYYKIYDGVNNFNAPIDFNDYFGVSCCSAGDYDGDGINDIIVGSHLDDDGYTDAGAFYIIHLNNNGSVKSYTKISNNSFTNTNPFSNNSARSLSIINDLDGNGTPEIVSGAYRYNSDAGAVVIVFLDSNENAISSNRIDQTDVSNITYGSRFGSAVCNYGDYNSDGKYEIVVGAYKYNNERGAIHIISLYTPLTVQPTSTQPLCHGDSTGVAIATAYGANPPFSYLWSTGSTNDTITNLTAGTYTVTVTNSLNATATSTVVITEPNAIAINTSSDTSFCLGMSTTITANASGGSGSKILHWDNNLSNASSHFVMPTQTTNYRVYATDANNCISDTSSILVSVNPLSNVSFTGLTLMNCLNDSLISLTGSPTGGSFAGLGIIGNNFDPSIAGVGIHSIIYNYTDTAGCSGADTNYTLINDIPTVYAGADTLLPCGSQGVLIGEPYETGYTYLWSPYAGLNNPFISMPLANPWMNSTFVLTKKSLSTQCSNTDTVIVNLPSGLPLINIVGDTTLCDGDSLHLVAMTNATDISWDYGITGITFDYLPSHSEFIAVTVKDSNLCISKDSAFVTVNPLPQPFLGNDTSIFLNDTLILDAGNYSSYLWSTGATTQTISIVGGLLGIGNHSFAVSVIDQNQCSGVDNISLSIIDAIEEQESDLLMKVYPNPTSGMITFEWDNNLTISSIEIYDAYGKSILQQRIKPSDITIQLDLSTYSTGIYYAKIKSINSERMIKIVLK